MTDVRILVVGGGPAGLSAAIQAQELGAVVTVLEAEQIGGTSLDRGPAPVRTLARAARLVRDWSSWERFGLEGAAPVPNVEAVLANSAGVARYAHDKKDIAGHIRQSGIDLVEQVGHVSFADPRTLRSSDGRTWTGDRIILAVGGHAASLPIPGGELALTYNDIRGLKVLPQYAAVIGAADTGCQMASIFADFGINVLLLESAPVILPAADANVSSGLQEAFESRGMDVRTGARVESLERNGDEVAISISRGGALERERTDAVFAAVGWPASVEDLDLGAAGVPTTATPSRSMITCGPMWSTFSPQATSTAVPSWSRRRGWRVRAAAWNAIRGPPSPGRLRRGPKRQFYRSRVRHGRFNGEGGGPGIRHRRRDSPLRRPPPARGRRRAGRFLQIDRGRSNPESSARTCSGSTRPRPSRSSPPR